ncbi:MAG: Asp-tRNA(Asn)/Glu-tRNA(Gln) amidotransferase subunit GatA [Candidatus Nealsonbacteria bacterium]|nr:Asp-tRNA(Asn)/Glu-tRNA(Gln) amidotransferase subunit GatA [Candidatus Nealsonbacteria bacterium]
MDIHGLTIEKCRQGLMNKEFSALEVAKIFLERIAKDDEQIFSYLTLTPELALGQAKAVDRLIAQGRQIPRLAGVPCAIKDNILLKDARCTAGSKILENYSASYDATVVEKLKKEGAVILGKTNLDEFAMGSSTENSSFGVTRNPRDLERVAGGSSGGSAAAVAGGMAIYSLGSDTGGSIRLPAAFCGVAGLKPTYGAVSRYGLIAFASSLDQIGPMAKTVDDVQTVFEIIAGQDRMDSTSVETPKIENSRLAGGQAKLKIENLRIGVPSEYFVKGGDPEVAKQVKIALEKYEKLGAKIVEVSLPNTEYALAAYYIISPAEASANLARFDGVKYGYSQKAENLADAYLNTRGRGFGKEVQRRIMLGTYVLSAGYYDAYYIRAQKVRTLIRNDFNNAFKTADVLMSPVSPSLPFKIGEKIKDPLSMYLVDLYTVSVNLAGFPALSLPIGEAKGLPVGLQIIGKEFEENKIFKIAKLYESN